MSYDYRDEIKSDIESEITDILGGPVKSVEEYDGRTVTVYRDPYDGYDKGDTIILYLKSTSDYDKVMENTHYRGELVDYSRSEKMLRFDCT